MSRLNPKSDRQRHKPPVWAFDRQQIQPVQPGGVRTRDTPYGKFDDGFHRFNAISGRFTVPKSFPGHSRAGDEVCEAIPEKHLN
ncbi:MAG TPA: hypothetical protein EYG03_05830 [Planctomycetes bacterium]|nr:hypothetical protein [Fuerstiella sp.]HIK91492.1 hypothetical protein [Planctomycetota bacterium]